MIKLIDILKEIKWLEKTYNLASDYYFPLTDDISRILNNGKTIRSFHITSLDKLNQLKSMEGTKKSLSTMTRYSSKELYQNLKAQWGGCILCYLEGNIVIKSRTDIMSIPDDNGRRWINFSNAGNTNSLSLYHEFKKFIDHELKFLRDEIKKANLEDDFSDELNIKRDIYIKKYINLAKKFAQLNSSEILAKLGGQNLHYSDEVGSSDEIIINNIKLLDCIYDNKASSEEIKNINSIFSGYKIPITVGTEEAYNKVIEFVKDRGGNSTIINFRTITPTKIY
jgi:hypothetical protein